MDNFRKKIAAPFARQSTQLDEIAEKSELLWEETVECSRNWQSEKPVYQRDLRDEMKLQLRWIQHATRLFRLKTVFPENPPGKKASAHPRGIGSKVRRAIVDARKKALLVLTHGWYGLNPERALLYRMIRAHNIFWYRSHSTRWKPKALLRRLENLAKYFVIFAIVALMIAGASAAVVLVFSILTWIASFF